MRNLVSLLWSEWKDLEQQIVAMNAEVEQIFTVYRLALVCPKTRCNFEHPMLAASLRS
jgi:hypothetical protein